MSGFLLSHRRQQTRRPRLRLEGRLLLLAVLLGLLAGDARGAGRPAYEDRVPAQAELDQAAAVTGAATLPEEVSSPSRTHHEGPSRHAAALPVPPTAPRATGCAGCSALARSHPRGFARPLYCLYGAYLI